MERSPAQDPRPRRDARVEPAELALGARELAGQQARARPRKLVPRLLLAVLGFALGGRFWVDGFVDGQESTVRPGTHPTELIQYADPSEGFSISYPSDWTKPVDRHGAIVALASPPEDSSDFIENIRVDAYDVEASTSLDEYESLGLKAAPNFFTEFDLLSSERVSLGGYPAFEDHYIARLPQGQFEGLQVTTLVGTRAYIITFTGEPGAAFALWLPTAREIIDSFAIEADSQSRDQ